MCRAPPPRILFNSLLYESSRDPSTLFSTMNQFMWFSLKILFILNTGWLQRILRNFLSKQSVQGDTIQLMFMTGCPGFKESNRLPHSPSPMPLWEQQEKRRRRALHQLPPPHTAPLGIAGACGIKNGTRWQTKTVLSTSLLCCLLYCWSMKRLLWGIQ